MPVLSFDSDSFIVLINSYCFDLIHFRSTVPASEFVESLHPETVSSVTPSVLHSGLRALAQGSPNPDAFLAKYEELKAKKYYFFKNFQDFFLF